MANDQLEHLRKQVAHADDARERMNLLMQLSLHLLNHDTAEAIGAVNEALAHAMTLGDRRSCALCNMRLGDCFRVAGDYQRALDHLDMAEELSEGVEHRDRLMSMLYRSRGLVVRSQGDMHAALELFERSLEAARDAADEQRVATVLATIGDTYRIVGDFPKALEIMTRSLRYWESVGNGVRRLGVLNDIGILYAELGEHARSIQVFEESLRLCREMGDRSTETMVMGNLGRVHMMLGEAERALEYELAALEIYRALGRRPDEATTLNAAAMMYAKLGRADRALECYSAALGIFETIGDQFGSAEARGGVGHMEIELGRRREGVGHLLAAIEIAEEIDNTKLACELHRSVAEIYETDGELARSLVHYKRSLQLATELESGEAIRAVAQAEMRLGIEAGDSSLFRERIARLEKKIGRDGSDHPSNGFAHADPDIIATLSSRYPTLTPTELRVCALLKINLTSKEIASLLSTSVRTVEGHRRHIRRKLGLIATTNLTMFLAAL